MLVIIDVQTYYTEDRKLIGKQRYNDFLRCMQARLVKAKNAGEEVLILLEEHSGRIEPGLASMISNTIPAHKTFISYKAEWDGSDEISSIIREQKLQVDTIELTGLFKQACVYRTWEGLREKYSLADKLRVTEDLVIGCYLYNKEVLHPEFLTCH